MAYHSLRLPIKKIRAKNAKNAKGNFPFAAFAVVARHKIMIATKESFEPHSSEQLPNSKRVYVEGKLHPDVRVPMREIKLTPTKLNECDVTVNRPVRVYDCSGPWGDPAFTG